MQCTRQRTWRENFKAGYKKFNTENVSQQLIEEQNLKNKKAIWREANESTVPQFPTISKEELQLITLGPYQIKMTGYYAEEHMDVHSDYKIFVHLEDPSFICAKIQ